MCRLKGQVVAFSPSIVALGNVEIIIGYFRTSNTRMIRRKVLSKILQEPLGPYHEKDVLDEKCKSTGRCQLVLYSFILEHNGQVIGYALDAFLAVLKASHPCTASTSLKPRSMDQEKIIASSVSVVSSTSLIQSGSPNSVSRSSRQSLTYD